MNVNAELQKMAERMFNDSLLQAVLTAYRQVPGGDGSDPIEIDFDSNRSALSSALDEEQNHRLSKMEALLRENCKNALALGFTRGLYAAFQDFFVEDPPKHPFETLVIDQLLHVPEMKRFVEYYHRRRRFCELYDQLEAQLGPAPQKLLDSVYCAWENREYGVLVQSFYMGYRWALTVTSSTEPVTSFDRTTKKLLLLEHELGFIHTMEELERRRKRESAAT